jgi:hypothetical protein
VRWIVFVRVRVRVDRACEDRVRSGLTSIDDVPERGTIDAHAHAHAHEDDPP